MSSRCLGAAIHRCGSSASPRRLSRTFAHGRGAARLLGLGEPSLVASYPRFSLCTCLPTLVVRVPVALKGELEPLPQLRHKAWMNPPGHESELPRLLREEAFARVHLRVVLGVGHYEKPAGDGVNNCSELRRDALPCIEGGPPDKAHHHVAHRPCSIKGPQDAGVETWQLSNAVHVRRHRDNPIHTEVVVVIRLGRACQGKRKGVEAVLRTRWRCRALRGGVCIHSRDVFACISISIRGSTVAVRTRLALHIYELLLITLSVCVGLLLLLAFLRCCLLDLRQLQRRGLGRCLRHCRCRCHFNLTHTE
mmetsp:Transcript_12940/g.28563  ORF Transcript_12940/g.28563 Transcript_12940/m.28563 type:complete len:307 (+) Transcript_12940:1676-2596(+)